MIFDLLIDIFFGVITYFLTFFPIISIPTDLIGSMAAIIEVLAVISFFMPIGILQLSIGVFVLFHGLEFGIALFNFIISKIPTVD